MPKILVNSHFILFVQNIKLRIRLRKICPLSPLHCGKFNQAERGHPSIHFQIWYQTYKLVYMKQSLLKFYDDDTSYITTWINVYESQQTFIGNK